MAKSTKQAKKRKVKVESIGEAHINATFNNIIISLTNMQGQVISWSSVLQIIIGQYVFKAFIALVDTPFIYVFVYGIQKYLKE